MTGKSYAHFTDVATFLVRPPKLALYELISNEVFFFLKKNTEIKNHFFIYISLNSISIGYTLIYTYLTFISRLNWLHLICQTFYARTCETQCIRIWYPRTPEIHIYLSIKKCIFNNISKVHSELKFSEKKTRCFSRFPKEDKNPVWAQGKNQSS